MKDVKVMGKRKAHPWVIKQMLNTDAGKYLRSQGTSILASQQGMMYDEKFDVRCPNCEEVNHREFHPLKPISEETLPCTMCDKLIYTSEIYIHEN